LSEQSPYIKLPDEIENILIQAAQSADNSYWKIGDVANELCDVFEISYSKIEVRASVANLIGWDTETIRDQQRMSKLIPEQKRIYNLSRHQYRACLNAGGDWEEYAERAVEYAHEHGGKTAPVNTIRMWVKGENRETPKWRSRLDRLIELAESIYSDPETPDHIRDFVQPVTVQPD